MEAGSVEEYKYVSSGVSRGEDRMASVEGRATRGKGFTKDAVLCWVLAARWCM